MHIKGSLHVHSTLSRDGTMTIAELVEWYCRKGYQFLALGEHAEDLDEAKVRIFNQQIAENSSPQFCVIPGIEFVCDSDIHILGVGVKHLILEKKPLAVIQEIHEQGGFAILAHPKRIKWKCPEDVLLAADAVEIWNIGYDGKYLPSPQALGAFQKMQRLNPRLFAVASHDFHRTPSFYDVAIQMDVRSLSPDTILWNLRHGCYEIRSRFFRAGPGVRLSWSKALFLRVFGQQLSNMRKARSFLLRWL